MEERTTDIPRVFDRIKGAPSTAALMFFAAGALAIICTYTPIAHRADLWLLRWLGAGDLVIGVLICLLPWERWADRALLVIPVVALPMIGIFESSGALTPYTYPVFFIVVFVWIGLCLPPRTSLPLAPLAAATYLLPVWSEADSVGARDSALIVLPVCALIAEVISRAVARVRTARGGMERLLGAAKALTVVSSTKEATDLLASLAYELLDANAVVVFLSEQSEPHRFVASAWCNVPPEAQDLVIDTELEPSGIGKAIRRGTTLFVGEHVGAHMNPRLQELTGAEAGLFFPLAGQKDYVGAICVLWTRSKSELDSLARQAIELLSLMAGRVVDRLRAAARLSREAERDPLTGLCNRRSFQPLLEASEPGDAIVLIDLDHFKTVNDRYGHAEGDMTLVSLAQCLESAVRGGDAAARFGGEEFALLLSEGGQDGAAAVIERLRRLWEKTNPRTTFSAGIAVRRRNETIGHTLRRADAALYLAKDAGRNRTEIASVIVA